ncbi:LysE family translocator [Povalibacter sp.]|uniref:LysE family translocator n=1 Tax=Povalibacter sp. TaxID=1962978 RepID=UPI002F3FDAB7
MIRANLLAFIGTAFILTVTPGLDTAVVLRTAALEGARHGMAAALGIGVGCLCWGAAVALGLGAILLTSPGAFLALKLTGAGYLVWFGATLLLRPRRSMSAVTVADILPSSSLWLSARRGFTTNILNPKVGLFYITLLPQFVPAAASTATYSLLLACAHVVLAVVWFIALAVMADSMRRHLGRPGMLPFMDRLTGGVFVSFGLHLTLT